MRKLGLTMLLLGFAWLVWQVGISFTEHQYVRSIWQTQQLPAGESVPRSDAARAIRDLSLNLKDHQQRTLFPAALMLLAAFFRPLLHAQQPMQRTSPNFTSSEQLRSVSSAASGRPTAQQSRQPSAVADVLRSAYVSRRPE